MEGGLGMRKEQREGDLLQMDVSFSSLLQCILQSEAARKYMHANASLRSNTEAKLDKLAGQPHLDYCNALSVGLPLKAV